MSKGRKGRLKNLNNNLEEQNVDNLEIVEKVEKVKKDSWMSTYSDYLLNMITKGNLEEQTSNFQVSFNKVLAESHVKQVIQILRMPALVPVGHLERIRREVLESIPINQSPFVDIQIHEHYTKNYMPINSKKVSKLYGSVNRALNEQKNTIAQIREYLSKPNDGRLTMADLDLAQNNLTLRRRKLKSFDEVAKHRKEGGEYVTAYIFLEVVAKDKALLEKVMENIESILQLGHNDDPYEIRVLSNDIMDFLGEYGIASFHKKGKKGMRLPTMDLPSTILSTTEEFNSGIVRSVQPRTCIGNRVENNDPIHIDFTETDDAYNVLVLGDTGSGKTKAMMYMFLSLMLDPRSNAMVDDYKGMEWSQFARIFDKHAIVSLNMSNPTFVNSMVIPDWEKFHFNNPKASYLLAYNTTIRMLGSLFPVTGEHLMVIESILSDLIDYLYLSSGVDIQEPMTYEKSKGLHFADTMITKWSEFIKLESFKDKYDRLMVDLVNETLYKYFDRRGAKRFLFENEIDIESLMDKKFIVFDHGMDIAGGSSIKTTEELMCGMVQKSYISNLYTSLNFVKGEYTYEFMEEVVRQLSNPFTTAYLVDELVGKRSSNKRNFLAFNSLEVLLNPTENKDNITKIEEQIGVYMIGRCKDRVVDQLVHHIGRPEIRETLSKVASQSHLNPKYDKSFAYINYRCGSVRGIHAYKAIIPRVILDNYMNRTYFS